jgi:metaxin
MSKIPMPAALQKFYSFFPLHVYEQELEQPASSFNFSRSSSENSGNEAEGYEVEDIASNPILFIQRPLNPEHSLLSSDVECVKWQAYLALRGIPGGIKIHWELASEGALDGRLPNLYLPPPNRLLRKEKEGQLGTARIKGELLESRRIPSWVDGETSKFSKREDEDRNLEGYQDEEARDESKAWVTLLEGDIRAALRAFEEIPSIIKRITSFPRPEVSERPLLSVTFTGLSSMIPPWGSQVAKEPIFERYKEGIAALSVRLGNDKWFLGSRYELRSELIIFVNEQCYIFTGGPRP